ncbi:MAG: hypothetical protein IKN87_02705 [Bacilli bacterium]|nr:hypothetical protein [Bacilli bacterium]
MGLFDKVKNMFTEEVEEPEEEVKVDEIKKEVTHVAIESPSVKPVIEEKEEVVEEVKPVQPDNTKKAVFFNDRDFEDLAKPRHTQVTSTNHSDEFFSKEELARMYGSNATKEKKEEPKEKIFKPTPIISPVYGILDKNYHKEDIVERKDTTPIKPKTSVTIDTIRNKAYGTLEEQLKDQALYDKKTKREDVDLFDELEHKNDALVFEDEDKKVKKSSNPEEITMDLTKELDSLLMRKQNSINELSRESRNRNVGNQDLFNLIDEMVDEGEDK